MTKEFKFKVTKNVTLPLLKQVDDVPNYVKIENMIYTGKEIKNTASGDVKEKPAELMQITDLETGEQMEMIVNAVLKGTLEENYPLSTYVGHSFEIIKHSKAEGKRYNTFSVKEIEVTK